MMRSVFLGRVEVVTVAFVLGSMVYAFAPAQSLPAFDVASIKRNRSVSPVGRGLQIRPEQLEAISVPVQALVIQAYGVDANRIIGLPDWTRSDFYDVRARTSQPSTRQEVLAMLQSLLATRFSLRVHPETREMDVYALIVARRDGTLGPQLQPVVVNCDTNRLVDGSGPGLYPRDGRPPCGNVLSNARVVASGPSLVQNRYAALTMERLARTLRADGRAILDKTGLSGTFDADLQYQSEGLSVPGSVNPPDGVPLREALRQQLGLDLRPERGSVEFLVVDSIERPGED
jgi:uncharacterized protein (TIGR03435 family)